MHLQSDSILLSTYAAAQSPPAFEALVKRHLDLVYSAARRQVRDPALAQDVTQAVFIILSRRARARSIRNPDALAGWLLKTTRYASLNALKSQARRHAHETKAAAMTPTTFNPHHQTLPQQISPLIDQAMSHLPDSDRSIVALRFFDNCSFSAIAASLGISEEAAQKRVRRAVHKLRTFLNRQGIDCPADVLAMSLVAPILHPAAPSNLLSMITSSAASSSAVTLANTTARAIFWSHAKLALGTLAATIALCTAVTIVAPSTNQAHAQSAASPTQAPTQPPIRPAATSIPATTQPGLFPLKITNFIFIENWNKEFQAGIDPNTIRPNGTGVAAVLLQSTTKEWGKSGTALHSIPPLSLVGHRIRFSAWLKTENLANWASLRLLAMDGNGRIYAHDDTAGDDPLVGSNDWTRREIVCDIPPGCTNLRFGMSMYGAGKIWMDDAQLDIVDETVPITDDRRLHPWSFSRKLYDCKLDETVQRNGHPTRLLSSSSAQNGFWLAWDQNDRNPEKYFGKKVRISAWIKTQAVTAPSGITVRILGPAFQSLTQTPSVRTNIRGTTDWKKYQVTTEVPDDCQCLCTGIRLCGKGKLWVDDLQYEILDK